MQATLANTVDNENDPPKLVYLVPGTKRIQVYNFATGTMVERTISKLPYTLSHTSVPYMYTQTWAWIDEDTLFICGGVEGGKQDKFTNKCFEYKFDTDNLVAKNPMNMKRCVPGIYRVGPIIFAFGGFIGTGETDTCEMYETDTNNWTMLPVRLPFPAEGVSVCRVQRRIFIAAFNEASVAVFDPAQLTFANYSFQIPFGVNFGFVNLFSDGDNLCIRKV
jgi:hypothetical protein